MPFLQPAIEVRFRIVRLGKRNGRLLFDCILVRRLRFRSHRLFRHRRNRSRVIAYLLNLLSATYQMPLILPNPANVQIRKTALWQTKTQRASGQMELKDHLVCHGGKEGDYIEFEFSGFEDREYNLSLYCTKATDYGNIRLYVNHPKRKTVGLLQRESRSHKCHWFRHV